MINDPWTVATARVALVLYVTAVLVLLRDAAARGTASAAPGGARASPATGAASDRAPRVRHTARALWGAGMLAYLAHVVAAFHFVHGWSHQAALAETARQTREFFGLDSGFGLWFNYLFTLVWATDAAWWWIDEDGYGRRPRRISVAVHAFIAFMFFNGAVVFARGPSRWIGLLAIVVLFALWFQARRSRSA